MELLPAELAPYVGREFANVQDKAVAEARRLLPADDRINGNRPIAQWDAAVVVRTVTENSRTLKFTSQGFEAE